MIKSLIFDFDGLIMDTETAEVEGWQEVYRQYGQEFPLKIWVREVVGSTSANFDPAVYLTSLIGQQVDSAVLHARTRAVRLAKQAVLSPMPGVIEIIQAAQDLDLSLAIASSSGHEWVEGYLRQLGILSAFGVIKCREDVKQVKPHPDLFLAVLQALELNPEEALVFEDSPNGILAAKRAGLRVVAVPNPVTVHGDMDGADLRLASLKETSLAEILEWANSTNHHPH